MSKRIEEFIGEIKKARVVKQLKAVCAAQLEYYRENFEFTTYRTYLTDCRNELRKLNPEHKALKYLTLPREQHMEFRQEERAKVYEKSGHLCPLDPDAFILKCEELLSASSYYRKAIGLAGLTGRRISEILVSARFEAVDESHLLFSGQLKTKKSENARIAPYVIPCLGNGFKIVNVWRELRAQKIFISGERNLDKLALIVAKAHTITADQHSELMLEHGEEIRLIAERANAATSKEIGKVIKKEFAEIISNPKLLQTKSLRAGYAHIAFDLFEDESAEKDSNFYFSQILGHSINDLSTAQSYKIFYLAG